MYFFFAHFTFMRALRDEFELELLDELELELLDEFELELLEEFELELLDEFMLELLEELELELPAEAVVAAPPATTSPTAVHVVQRLTCLPMLPGVSIALPFVGYMTNGPPAR